MRDPLVDKIFSLHVREYGAAPEVIASSPGLVLFMGEHTNACEGYTLTAATKQRIYVALSLREDASLQFYHTSLKERKKMTLSTLYYRREDKWANYLKSLVAEFIAENHLFLGLNVTILSDIPSRQGYHSVTALTTATGLALRQLCGVVLDDESLAVSIGNSQKSYMLTAGYVGNALALMRSHAEQIQVFDSKSLESKHYDLPRATYSIINSQVPFFLDNEELLYRAQAMKDGFRTIRNFTDGVNLRNIDIHALKTGMRRLSEDAKRYCSHVLDEHRRIAQVIRFLENGDMHMVGRYIQRSYESLRDNLAVYSPEVDWLIHRCMEEPEVYSAQLLGTGYGGCILVMSQREIELAMQEKFEEYEQVFGFKPTIEPFIFGDAARVEDLAALEPKP